MTGFSDLRLREWLKDRPAPIVSRKEALALGFSDRMIHRRVASGWWQVVDRGVYDVDGSYDGWLATLTGATTKLPAVVSHHSAAELHGFPLTPRGKLMVTVPHRTTHSYPGVDVRQSTDLVAEYMTEVEGLPATTPERTVFDIAHRHKLRFLTILLEKLIVANQIEVDSMHRLLGELGRRGRPGTVRTRDALDAVMPVIERLESELERIVLELIRDAGLPIPEAQISLPWRSDLPGRVDFAYPQYRLIIECDGRKWHVAADVFEDDRRRDNLAALAGWRVIRITWKMATEEPEQVVGTIREALRTAAVA